MGSNLAFVPRRTESQMTIVGRNASIAPEPAGQSNASSGGLLIHNLLSDCLVLTYWYYQ